MGAATFQGFIRSLGLRHFAPSEFLIGLERGNTVPPRELWPNIALPAGVVDRCRDEFGKPIRITSAYRNLAYNRKVGGARLSSHPAFSALDFEVLGLADQREAAEFCRAQRGQLFVFSARIERSVFRPDGVKSTPFEEVPTYDERGGEGTVMRFAGGVGEYRTFTHVDGRGLNHSWTG